MPNNRGLDVLRTSYLTDNVLNIEEPPGLLKGLLADPVTAVFPGTDNVEFGRERLDREGAPFIPMEAEAVYVGDRSRTMTNMEIPNIAMRKSIRAGDFAHDRSIGDQIYLTAGSSSTTSNSLEARVDRYQRDMVRRIENTLEWWVSNILDSGSVTYSDSAYDAFTYAFGRDAGNSITASPTWATATASAKLEDLQTAKRIVADREYLSINVGICGTNAAVNVRGDDNLQVRLDYRNVDENRANSYIDINAPYAMQGAVTPIGRLAGIELWEYSRQVTLLGGSPVDLVDPDAIYLFHQGRENDIRKFFGPVYDLQTARGRAINTERFSKSWMRDYPSDMQMIVQSRPLIAPFRPDFCVKLTVL